MDDRRDARRFPLNLPLEIQAAAQAGQAFNAETRDVSYRGLYFVVDRDLESGSPIQFVLTLPREFTLSADVHIRCSGRVVRVDKPGPAGPVGVAAIIDRYEFLPQLS